MTCSTMVYPMEAIMMKWPNSITPQTKVEEQKGEEDFFFLIFVLQQLSYLLTKFLLADLSSAADYADV